MNFVGVVVGGIAVAYALVQLLPADVLSPPSGSPAVAMLVALFATALAWNVFTWWVRHSELELALRDRGPDRDRRR